MRQAVRLFNNRKLRATWDPEYRSWWVSVVDIIAALRDTDYDTARNYWKQLKHRRAKMQKTFTSQQMKLRCKDGKLRYSDVMLDKEIVKLIQSLPSNVSRGLVGVKEIMGRLAANAKALSEVFRQLCSQQYFEGTLLLRTTTVQRLL